MTESIVSTPVRLAKARRCGQRDRRRSVTNSRELARNRPFSRILASDVSTNYCQSDYESFTDSWLAADMTPGRRIRAITDYLRRPHPWDDPQMTHRPA
jgi:hypothetical protein